MSAPDGRLNINSFQYHNVSYKNKVLWRFFYNQLIDQAIIGIIQKLMNNPG
jgi:hypothetical protein